MGLIPQGDKMKLTKKQKQILLPYVQDVVDGLIVSWEAQRCIERILGKSFDGMTAAAEPLAVSYETGPEVRLEDVQSYIDACKEE
jgi:hypothetical protein